MLRRALVVVVAVAFAGALTHAPSARAQQCGLPDAAPVWIDYATGSVPFRAEVFGKPGIVAASAGTTVAPDLRKRGAQTIYWENELSSLVGTTTKPADPAGIDAAAGRLFDKAAASSGCATPLIGLNELHGAGTTTPWTATNGQYRANVLALLRALAARGTRPFLLINSEPYTGGEAFDWWRQAAEVADLVSEVYWVAPNIYGLGAVLGSRRMRMGYRHAIENFTDIGIPASRLGLMLGFQSGPSTGGREGLRPSSSWFEFVKLQTLAAKQVASELGIATVWSWGWGTFSPAGADPDKPAAACVYLWARDQSLCDAPQAVGEGFNASLTEGQISLPPGVQCTIDGKAIATAAVDRLAALTHDREVAFTALFARAVESERAQPSPTRVLAVERSLIASRFNGSRTAYLLALPKSGATLEVARAAIADELRRFDIARGLTVAAPSAAAILAFYSSYPAIPARLVSASPAPSWLGGRAKGFALAPAAPEQLFALGLGSDTQIVTAEGTFTVRPLDETLPLGAIPLELARPAIRAALVAFARADAFDAWTTSRQMSELDRTTCLHDDLPSPGAVDLSAYLPFLSLEA